MRSIWSRVCNQEGRLRSEVNAPEIGDAPATVAPPSAAEGSAVTATEKVETEEQSKPEAEAEQNAIPTSNEAKPEVAKESDKVEVTDKPSESNVDAVPNESGDWQQQESILLEKVDELQKLKSDTNEDGLKIQLKLREQEVDLLKSRVKNLETELQAAFSKPGSKNHEMIENIKLQHEELLAKARGMIFDKTKMVKNQELQIAALVSQVQSLKDINQITKDLLEIRNNEVKAMEERYQALEARVQGEKEKYALLIRRAQSNTAISDDVKREYDTQMAIFRELRGKYEEKVKALVAENERLKQAILQHSKTE